MHSLCGSQLHNQRNPADLILQDQPITFFHTADHMAHMRFGKALIGSSEEEDAVFTLRIHLDDRMPLRFLNGKKVIRTDAVFPQDIPQDFTAGAQAAGMADRGACPGKRDGLI